MNILHIKVILVVSTGFGDDQFYEVSSCDRGSDVFLCFYHFTI